MKPTKHREEDLSCSDKGGKGLIGATESWPAALFQGIISLLEKEELQGHCEEYYRHLLDKVSQLHLE